MYKFIPVAALTGLLVLASGCPGNGGAGQEEPVRIDAERFRVETYPDDYALGGEQPLVTVIMFSDYACGPCGRSWKVAKHLSEHYGDLLVPHPSKHERAPAPGLPPAPQTERDH